jgi:hypothetical protein
MGGAFPEAGMAAVEVLKMKICDPTTFTSAKPKTAQGSGKASCLEHCETWGTRSIHPRDVGHPPVCRFDQTSANGPAYRVTSV